MKEAARNQTYVIEQNGRRSREAESRLKAYHPAENPAGKIPTLVEPHRQLERKRLGRQNPQAKSHEETWLMQRIEDKNPEDLLQRLLSQQNTNQRRSVGEIVQKRQKNVENDLEMRVVSPVERNSKVTLPNDEESVVALPQERERTT